MTYHEPVMLKETIEGLEINPEGVYVDATFGGGGHSKEILKHLKKGKLIAFDQDSDAEANVPDNGKMIFINHNFKYLKNFLKYYKIDKIDGLIADLGVSSHHLDTAERGFSYRFDSVPDMRMDKNSELSAIDVLNRYSAEDLSKIFKEYADINKPEKLSEDIISSRPIKSIVQFKEILSHHTNKKNEKKFLSQVFQAIRIEVNDEMKALERLLTSCNDVFKLGGRLVVITYHSVEDRLVKRFLKSGNTQGIVKKDFFGNTDIPFRLINKSVLVPNDAECNINNRSRSAKLRIAEKI